MLSTVYSPLLWIGLQRLSPDVSEAKHSISPEHSLPLLVLLFLSVISWKPNLALWLSYYSFPPTSYPPPLLSHSQLVIKFFICFVMTLRFLPSLLPSFFTLSSLKFRSLGLYSGYCMSHLAMLPLLPIHVAFTQLEPLGLEISKSVFQS